MENFKWEKIPTNLSYEEQSKLYERQKAESMKFVGEHLDEIKSIFNVQLGKPGDEDRAFAVEQIIDYLYTNPMDEYEKSGKTSTYTITLITLANIIDAANNNDEKAFAEKLENLPWEDAGTGLQIAQNTIEFAFWILSDEARDKLTPIFGNVIASKYNYNRHPSIKIGEFDSMERLPDLEKYNSETKAEIAKIKPQQGEE